jgi:hypothetical protein
VDDLDEYGLVDAVGGHQFEEHLSGAILRRRAGVFGGPGKSRIVDPDVNMWVNYHHGVVIHNPEVRDAGV